MGKQKKEELVEKKNKLSYETEIALVGIMISVVSLIGLLNQGYFGSIITYALVFAFGSWYYGVLIASIYFGMYLFIKRKKPKFMSTLTTISFVLLIVFLSIASSKYAGANLSNWFSYYKNAFYRCVEGVHVDISKINQVGGGIVGYSMYALLVGVLGEFMSNVVIVMFVFAFAYLSFKKPLNILYKKIIKYIDLIKENKEKVSKKEETQNNQIKVEEKMNDENINLNKKETTHFLTYDIFLEKIFEDEDSVIAENNVTVTSSNMDLNVRNFTQNEIKESIVVESIQEEIDNDNIYDYNLRDGYGKNEDYSIEVKEEKIVEEPTIIKMEKVYLNSNEEKKEVDNNEFVDYKEKTNGEPYLVKLDDVKDEDLYSLLINDTSNNSCDELKDEVELNCKKINQKLEELNINAKVSGYIIGPCVTRYEIVPEIGVRVSSIVNIQNDLKLALAAINLRMEAPIPGKSAVGIEVANKKRYPVYLKDVLESKKDDEDSLLVAIGKDLSNTPVSISIDKMPHLLIAGATGSGKSVCINAIIMSLIIRSTPEEVKMILIDPKKVEMLPYANMPHLLCPVVTDPKKASNALKKVVSEMDKRYDLFASCGVRNIDVYNKLPGKQKLCKLVVIIDELADLMLVASKEVEESIQRITQLARAAGIYLIVATQRPSVDVITGVIKANIPSRIAFSVASTVDSRTILDRSGAEDLLGKGDMLMDISGSNNLNRVQGVFVTDEEINKVVSKIKLKYNIEYQSEFLNLEDEKKDMNNILNENGDNRGEDELYKDIKLYVIHNQKASTSLLQRHFSLGYARAARMMDRLEEDGIVSSSNGIKPRDILVKEELFNNGNGSETNQ